VTTRRRTPGARRARSRARSHERRAARWAADGQQAECVRARNGYWPAASSAGHRKRESSADQRAGVPTVQHDDCEEPRRPVTASTATVTTPTRRHRIEQQAVLMSRSGRLPELSPASSVDAEDARLVTVARRRRRRARRGRRDATSPRAHRDQHPAGRCAAPRPPSEEERRRRARRDVDIDVGARTPTRRPRPRNTEGWGVAEARGRLGSLLCQSARRGYDRSVRHQSGCRRCKGRDEHRLVRGSPGLSCARSNVLIIALAATRTASAAFDQLERATRKPAPHRAP